MKSFQYGPVVTVVAGENLTGKRFVNQQGKHTVDKRAIGVVQEDADSGEAASVQCSGIAVVEAGGAITVGTHQYVSMDANGKALALAPVEVADLLKICGIPLDSATETGQFIRVKLV